MQQTQQSVSTKKRKKRKGDYTTEATLKYDENSHVDVISDDIPGSLAFDKELREQLNSVHDGMGRHFDPRALAFSLLCRSWVLASGAMPPAAAAYADAEDWELADLAWYFTSVFTAVVTVVEVVVKLIILSEAYIENERTIDS